MVHTTYLIQVRQLLVLSSRRIWILKQNYDVEFIIIDWSMSYHLSHNVVYIQTLFHIVQSILPANNRNSLIIMLNKPGKWICKVLCLQWKIFKFIICFLLQPVYDQLVHQPYTIWDTSQHLEQTCAWRTSLFFMKKSSEICLSVRGLIYTKTQYHIHTHTVCHPHTLTSSTISSSSSSCISLSSLSVNKTSASSHVVISSNKSVMMAAYCELWVQSNRAY